MSAYPIPQRIRIVEPGWKNYNGFFGGVEFANSISVEVVEPTIANRLGCLIRIEFTDSSLQAGHAADLQRSYQNRAPIVDQMQVGLFETVPGEKEVINLRYTREDLEGIADTRGIAGMREIADKFGVRGRSIVELIDGIVKAQQVV